MTQSTFAAATLTVTYTYIPTPQCLIEPGVYTVVQTPELSGYTNGKESQPGIVLPPNGPPQSLTVTIANTSTNAPNNDFGKLLTLTPTTTPTPTPAPTPTPTPTPTETPQSAPPEVGAITIAPPGATSPQILAPATTRGIARFGVHHQPTKLVVQLGGNVNAAQATNPGNYWVTRRGLAGRFGTAGNVKVPITSAVYDATSQEVLLTSTRRLNLHDHFELSVNLAALSTDGMGTVTSTVFGGRQILGGFVCNHGRGTELVPLRSHKDQFGVRAVPFGTLGPLAASDGPRGGHR